MENQEFRNLVLMLEDVQSSVEPIRLEELARQLRSELVEIDGIDSAKFATRERVPPNAKGAEALDWSTILISLTASGGVLVSIVTAVQRWLSRHKDSSISLVIGGDKIRITGATPEVQQKIIDLWIEKHQSSSKLSAEV